MARIQRAERTIDVYVDYDQIDYEMAIMTSIQPMTRATEKEAGLTEPVCAEVGQKVRCVNKSRKRDVHRTDKAQDPS